MVECSDYMVVFWFSQKIKLDLNNNCSKLLIKLCENNSGDNIFIVNEFLGNIAQFKDNIINENIKLFCSVNEL